MDVISNEVGRGPSHAMLFADDLVLGEHTREEAEEQLELWRNAIENKGIPVSRSKTEYLPPSFCHDNVKLGGEEIKTVTTFKYRGSMFDAEGGTTTDCKKRFRLAWNKRREVTGVICDKKVPVKLKHKIYKTVIIIIIIIIIIIEAFIKHRIPGKTTCSKALQYRGSYKN